MMNHKFQLSKNNTLWWVIIAMLIGCISAFHYTTPIQNGHWHLIYMQSYFIPILIGAFQFGVRGGLGAAISISLIYMPHLAFDWVGNLEHRLLGFMHILLYNLIGYLTGLKAQREQSEKARYQKTALKLEQSLEQLKQQTEKLAEVEGQLHIADRRAIIGEMAASLAHEIRNPLGSIQGTVEILRDELPESAQNDKFFKILIDETRRLSVVLENYLSFARRPKDSDVEYDTAEVIQNTTMLLAGHFRKKNIKLNVLSPSVPIRVTGDPNYLTQILVNLALNAIQAMPEGGELTIRTENSQNKDGGTKSPVRIHVQDQGCGIQSDELNKIFTPFYTTKENGTGLGLAIVKRLVDSLHWQIDVSSSPGEGSVFTLSLPVNAQQKQESQEDFNEADSID